MYNLRFVFPVGLREKGLQDRLFERGPCYRSQSGFYLAADLPLNPGEAQETPAGGSPPVLIVRTEEETRLIPREIRLQGNGTEKDIPVGSFLFLQPIRKHPLASPVSPASFKGLPQRNLV